MTDRIERNENSDAVFRTIRTNKDSFSVEALSERMFGPGSLQVANFGFTPGTRTNITTDDIAAEINHALSMIEAGEFEEVNETTREAIAELEAGKGKRVRTVAELMVDLESPDE